MSYKKTWQKIWHFIWHDDSWASLIANIILAFVLIKFIVYPGLGLVLGTDVPLVAVVSGSMHHDAGFDDWWGNAKGWYEENGIMQSDFIGYPLRNGFDKGDIMFISDGSDVVIGDIIVFESSRPFPIIHRVVGEYIEDGEKFYVTKGDNYLTNSRPLESQFLDETKISADIVKGKALFRVPFVGYVKLLAMELGGLFS